ncbi:hypothetical protein AB205_0175620 [Aquarana catesbeiana]|uniref:Uncharacterized protein n=1 Tax=Aquarana catesbeiana TaxID=8400 RepID=A0A2G9QK93_AQUCT|nr:hypothetical protein AB205_0175620 [Aquarana catesbeiana]
MDQATGTADWMAQQTDTADWSWKAQQTAPFRLPASPCVWQASHREMETADPLHECRYMSSCSEDIEAIWSLVRG